MEERQDKAGRELLFDTQKKKFFASTVDQRYERTQQLESVKSILSW